ncbi:MAG: LCP family protein [Actinomycetota bacterium]|nr:LCP family protein [Actinomycetota bacterium]
MSEFKHSYPHKKKRHVWRWVLGAVVIVCLALGCYGAWLYNDTENKIQDRSIPDSVIVPKGPGDPYNTLLVGSDSRSGLTPEEQLDLGAGTDGVTGERADTLIIAHVDPESSRVTMVQFPRDLYVKIYGGPKDRINIALEGGSTKLIRTVKMLTGLQIHHYAMVNIAGFRDLVDAVDGVDLCLTEPIPFDDATGIEVTADELPLVHFDGDRALRFVRSRNLPNGDLGRIQNQQKFLAAALDKLTSASTLLNPAKLLRLPGVATKNVSVDSNTGIPQLRALAGQLQSFDPKRFEAYTAPVEGPLTLPDGREVLRPDRRAMEKMFGAIARNISPADAEGKPKLEPIPIPEPKEQPAACRT